MPQHPGSVRRPTHGLSVAARAAEGIPQPDAIPLSPTGGGGGGVAELLAALQAGNMSPEVLLQLLTMLAGLGPGGLGGGVPGGGGGSPIEAAMFGG